MNTTYGSRYNPPTFTDKSNSGTDTDFPLFAMTHISVGYTDNGVTEWHDWVTTETPIPFPWFIRDQDALESNARQIVYEEDGQQLNLWQWADDYNKIFSVSAYAYVSCNIADLDYKTKTKVLLAEVPEDFSFPSKREPQIPPRFGYFSEFALVEGDVEGWDYELGSNPNAQAKAKGKHLIHASVGKHSVESVPPTLTTARNLYIVCDLCNDSGCDVCNRYRRHPWQ